MLSKCGPLWRIMDFSSVQQGSMQTPTITLTPFQTVIVLRIKLNGEI